LLYLNKISNFLQFVNLVNPSKTGVFRLFSSDNKKTHENKTSFSQFEKGVPFSAHFFCMYENFEGALTFEQTKTTEWLFCCFMSKRIYTVCG